MGMERVPLIRERTESVINVGGTEEVYIIRVNTRAPPLTRGIVYIFFNIEDREYP